MLPRRTVFAFCTILAAAAVLAARPAPGAPKAPPDPPPPPPSPIAPLWADWPVLGGNLQCTGMAARPAGGAENGGERVATFPAWNSGGPSVGPDGNVYVTLDGGLNLEGYTINYGGIRSARAGLTCLDRDLNWRWSVGVSCGGTPAIGPDGTIYIGTQHSSDGSGIYANDYVYAIREVKDTDGNPVLNEFGQPADIAWAVQAWGQVGNITFAPDGTVVAANHKGAVWGMDPATGAERWRFQAGGTISYGFAFSPDGNTLYFGSQDKYLYALALTPGAPYVALKWAVRMSDWVLAAPSVDSYGNIYVVTANHQLCAVSPTGSAKWTARMRSATWVSGRNSPALDESRNAVYTGGGDGVYAFSLNSGKLKWKIAASPINGHAAVDNLDGTVYYAEGNLGLLAANPDGSEKWRREGVFSGAPAIAKDGTLYVAGSQGTGVRAYR